MVGIKDVRIVGVKKVTKEAFKPVTDYEPLRAILEYYRTAGEDMKPEKQDIENNLYMRMLGLASMVESPNYDSKYFRQFIQIEMSRVSRLTRELEKVTDYEEFMNKIIKDDIAKYYASIYGVEG